MSPQNHDKKMVLATLNTFKHVGFGGAMDDIQWRALLVVIKWNIK